MVVVIPAFNESRSIARVVSGCLKHADEVVVVDDGSTDGTGEEARRAGATILVHSRNMGKWASLKDGISLALSKGFDFLVTMDGDGQHDPNEIPKLLSALEHADVAVGCRSRREMPPIRRLSNWITTSLLRALFSIQVSDSQCGFRAYRRWAAEKLLEVRASGFEGESESLVILARAGARMVDVPIRTIYGGEKSKIRGLRDTIRFIRTVLSLIVRK